MHWWFTRAETSHAVITRVVCSLEVVVYRTKVTKHTAVGQSMSHLGVQLNRTGVQSDINFGGLVPRMDQVSKITEGEQTENAYV